MSMSASLLSNIAYIAIPVALLLFVVVTFLVFYKKCPPNKLLVVYGKTFGKQSAKVVHGGGCLIIPFLQDHEFLSLAPIDFDIDLSDALSANNIRINLPAVCTIAIGNTKELTVNASERLLGMSSKEIKEAAENITLGQLRSVVASLTIEQINSDRQSFDEQVRNNIDDELKKLGLYIVNLNIRDISDNSGYIDAIGQKASAKVVQQALIDVAEETKRGELGKAASLREQHVGVAKEQALAEQSIADTQTARDIHISTKNAEAQQGKNEALALERQSEAQLIIKTAQYNEDSETAKYKAQESIEMGREKAELARKRVDEVVDEQISALKKAEIAQGDANAVMIRAEADANARILSFEAEAKGIKLVTEAKAKGFKDMVEAAGGSSEAVQLLMVEKMETLVGLQTEAISKMKIDSINVWDGGSKGENGGGLKSFMTDFLTLGAPMQEIAKTVGFQLPAFMGQSTPSENQDSVAAEKEINPVSDGSASSNGDLPENEVDAKAKVERK